MKFVVGVDGSAGSKNALQWALEHARRTHADVEVVVAWRYPKTIAATGLALVVPPSEFETRARDTAEELVTECDTSGLSVAVRAAEGHEAEVLLAAARNADLLVIGAKGRHGFPGMTLGSVAAHCVAHASVPTVIVPDTGTHD